LSRLVWTERTEKVTNYTNKRSWLQVVPLISLLCVLGVFAFQFQSHNNPAWIIGGLASVGAIIGLAILWAQHLNKH
jgi:protein-S-isoprenylcysteine O-methyltransferase Ste14